MKNITFKKNDMIIRKGDESNGMYLIKSGIVGVYSDLPKKGRTMISMLGKGKFIGEMGVIDNEKRSADVVALQDTEVIEIPAEDFGSFVAGNTTDVIALMKNLCERLRSTNKDLDKAARTISCFVEENDNLNTKSVSGLKGAITSALKFLGISGKEKQPKTKYAAGEVIFEQGDIGTTMFRILEGEASVVADYGKADQAELAVLKKGDIFGEMAVIEEERRTATVIAKTDLTVDTVANGKLKSFLTAYPEDAVKIMANMSAKLRATTQKYLETLGSISEFVASERDSMGMYVGGEDFIQYAAYYDSIMEYSAIEPSMAFYSHYNF